MLGAWLTWRNVPSGVPFQLAFIVSVCLFCFPCPSIRSNCFVSWSVSRTLSFVIFLSNMHTSIKLSAATLLFVLRSLVAAQSQCGCYQTSAGDYFGNYQFLDFRNGKPSNYDTFFTPLEVADYGPLDVKNTMTSANIGFNNGVMSLLTENNGGQTSADIYSNPTMLYGSFRMHAQITGASGAVAGFFTYLDANNEQDIEILTDEAENQIHYTDHDDGGAGNGNPTLNTTFSGSRTDFNTYRLDWVPSKASFIVNNDQPKELTAAVPTAPCTLDVNMWSAGNGWGGYMAEGQSATLNIQWIEAVYNPGSGAKSRVRRAESQSSSSIERRQSGACANPCKVDGVAQRGQPEPV